ncbi:chemotaxis protein MotC [Kumtagia ephedrae]|uniref:Chemotaxis protein MotC n=1 Tax=Kumtagia ephedrae TaxID=2116701 RepID=A0A2P7SLG6_9HYPH|nr:chemotaxis protein MotC [Mesorhizobium ephedrae]PSJ63344.1 chemotaxis protein MotC [Mesorhizobium ephedrae]
MKAAPAFAAALLAAAHLSGAAGAAPAGELEPYQMVRSLQHVQDRVATGDHAALPIQRRLLEMIDRRLRTAIAAELMQPVNVQAMLIYAMSGGNPATLQSILERLHLGERDGRIAAGIIGYLNGGTRSAAAALKPIEPMREPAEIGAFLALLKGSLTSLEDPRSALGLFDQARLLSPGTLVEEAALRRSVALAATTGDSGRFVQAAGQYVRGYIRSPYASQFADAFVSGVVTLHDTVDLDAVEAVAAFMNPEQRKVVYLRIARRAAIDGLVELSNFAAAKAAAIDVPTEEPQDPRLLLYSSLTGVASEPAETIRARLAGIDRGKLSDGDRKLLEAVLAVSDEIVGKPAPQKPAATKAAKPPAAEGTAQISAPAELAEPDPDIPVAAAVADQEPTMPPVSDMPRAVEAPTPAPAPTMAAEAPATAVAPEEPADPTLAEGRKRLAEIDALLAGATD